MSTGKQDVSKECNAFMFRVKNIFLPNVGKYTAVYDDLIFNNQAIRLSVLPTCPKLKSHHEAICIFALPDLFLYRTETLLQHPIGPVHIPFGIGHINL